MASRPTTPIDRDPEDSVDYRFRTNGTACEWGESYHPGGYHPVHLGDVLHDRYRIIRKLGYGSFSTAWLALDLQSQSFVALKMSVSRLDKSRAGQELAIRKLLPRDETASRYAVAVLDDFEITGPNGQHSCLALEPMGPHIAALVKKRYALEFSIRDLDSDSLMDVARPRFPKHLSKRILRDILLGLCFLHSHSVVHGDLHPGNILANITPLSSEDAEDRLRLGKGLEQPATEGVPLRRRDGKVDLWAPSYLLPPAPLDGLVSFDFGIDPAVKIADLGAAFSDGDAPVKVVTPVALRAPEIILRGFRPLGQGIDIWAFGCLVFELLTGRPLFVRLESLEGDEESDQETNDEHLIQFTEVLGKLPEDLASLWERRHRYYDAEWKRLNVSKLDGSGDERSGVDADGSEDDDEKATIGSKRSFSDTTDSELQPTKKAKQAAGDKLLADLDLLGGGDGSPPTSPQSTSRRSSFSEVLADPGTFDPLEQQLRKHKPSDMDETEEKEVSKLLRWILQYDASKRPSAEEILRHPWFSV